MSNAVDREGVFRGVILEYGVKEFESGSVGVTIRAMLSHIWHEKEWSEWAQYEQEAFGTIFIIKTNGTTSEHGVRSLCKAAGWDGSIKSIDAKTWDPIPCQFTVKSEEYKGKTQYRIEFVDEYDATPGVSLTNVTSDRIKDLDARFGASLRAIAGNAKRNATPANGSAKPSAPPKPSKASKAESQPATQPADEIPF